MARKSLVSIVSDALRDRIVSGELAVGGPLPSEGELSVEFEVSRVTVREALRILTAEGLIKVSSGIGAKVNPIEEWRSLTALMRYRQATGKADEVLLQLLTVRGMFESEAAAGAAELLSDEDIEDLRGCVARMRRATEEQDIDLFVEADLRFHDLIMQRSGNIFLSALFDPITRVLAEHRTRTSRIPVIQRNAIEEHQAVLEALAERDAAKARAVMEHHLRSVRDVLREQVTGETAQAGPDSSSTAF